MNMNTTISNEENFDITNGVISATLAALNDAPKSEFNFALFNLLKEAGREINRLKDNKQDLTIASISVRNIFELYLLIKHVFTDSKAFKSWMGQMHKDTTDILEGFTSLFAKFKKDVPELAEIQKYIDSTLDDSEYKSKGHFVIKDLATKYGLEEDYSAIHKLCSKIVHPSSIKVNAYQGLVANENYLNLFLYVGVYFSQQIEGLCNEIKDGIKA